jgi:hypothetical protein
MQQILIAKLHEYITQNNLDLLIALQQESRVSSYLKDKVDAASPLVDELLAENTPAYIIEERCMDYLTKDLRPSKFNYLLTILDDEFETDYRRLEQTGLITYEVVNLIEVCKPVFESLGFTEENEDTQDLRNAIIGAVKEYFETKA